MAAPANDVVFVFPPAHGNVGSFANHLGVGYLRAALTEQNIRCSQYLNPGPGTVREVASDILSQKPKIIGFTAYDANFPLCLAIARSVKQQHRKVKVVFGGPSATFGAEELMARHHAIDLCMIGEGEETGSRVLARLLDGALPEERHPGAVFRRDGKIISTGYPPLVGAGAASVRSALDSSPSPYLSGVLTDGRTGVLTGRGCTHHCQYCCFAALGRKKLRLHSEERVLAELEFIAAHQQRTGQHYVVPIHDDAFTLLPSRAKRLCQAMVEREIKLVLSCITRADAIDDELLQLMRAAGFVSLAFGLESAVPSVLRATGKVRPPDWPDADLEPEKHFVDQVRQSVVSAKKYGFNVGVSIILGLPTETAADGEETLRFVKSLPIDYYMHNFLWLFPGTPLWETHARYNVDCAINEMGLPMTTGYAYDVNRLPPRPKCALENDANIVRTLTADLLRDCNAPQAAEGTIGAVVIEAEELGTETAKWLHEVLAVGGTVLQLYPPLTRSERPLRIYQDRCTMTEQLVPARHHVQLERKGNGDGITYTIACSGVDFYRTHKPPLVSLRVSDSPRPMLAWVKGNGAACELCEAEPALMHSPEFQELSRTIDADPEHSPLQRMPIPPRSSYSGRWQKGLAPCYALNRLEIDGQSHVRCCRFGEPLGKVGDCRETLLSRFGELAAAAAERRGCERCAVTDCPRCPFPGMNDKAYCSRMRKKTSGLKTLQWIQVYSQLPSMVTRQRDRMAAE